MEQGNRSGFDQKYFEEQFLTIWLCDNVTWCNTLCESNIDYVSYWQIHFVTLWQIWQCEVCPPEWPVLMMMMMMMMMMMKMTMMKMTMMMLMILAICCDGAMVKVCCEGDRSLASVGQVRQFPVLRSGQQTEHLQHAHHHLLTNWRGRGRETNFGGFLLLWVETLEVFASRGTVRRRKLSWFLI